MDEFVQQREQNRAVWYVSSSPVLRNSLLQLPPLIGTIRAENREAVIGLDYDPLPLPSQPLDGYLVLVLLSPFHMLVHGMFQA